jgi:hypothetical protein
VTRTALQKTALRWIGICCLLTGGAGLCICPVMWPDWRPALTREAPYLASLFYPMRVISVACLTTLMVVGRDFIRLRTKASSVLMAVFAFELAYYVIGRITLLFVRENPLGVSFSYAYVLAKAGFVPQIACLLPVWGLPLTWWATRHVGPDSGTAGTDGRDSGTNG